ncbi:MAG: hypothetical protein JNM56_23295 [Planctomycetia bacterium]|nr:hypothetical protein [Planctomycetia bacterium]
MNQTLFGRLFLGAFTAGSLFLGLSLEPTAGRAQPEAAPREPAAQKFAFLGAASCSSTACHNNGGLAGSPRSEYTTWMLRDRHVRAYDALLTERSKRIVMNYRGLKDIKDAHPEKDLTCLQCHALDPLAAQQGHRIAYEDGVSCERCHGPAEKWIGVHHTRAWQTKTPQEKAALGFVPPQDTVTRIQSCAGCHVGTPELDVNHDLIAAGHPRLLFEYSSFLANMPPHWDIKADKRRTPDLEARAWSLGQIVSAQEALNLLAHRAKADPAQGTWPEFAEYDCYSCHSALKLVQPRAADAGRAPGAAAPNDWYWTLVPQALQLAGSPEAGAVRTALHDLRQELGQAAPDRDKVAQQARGASEQLGRCLANLGKLPLREAASYRAAFADMVKEGQKQQGSWDRACQLHLGMMALYQAAVDVDPAHHQPDVARQVREMNQKVRFRSGYDGPRPEDVADFWLKLSKLAPR